MESGPLDELTSREALTLIQIANGWDGFGPYLRIGREPAAGAWPHTAAQGIDRPDGDRQAEDCAAETGVVDCEDWHSFRKPLHRMETMP